MCFSGDEGWTTATYCINECALIKGLRTDQVLVSPPTAGPLKRSEPRKKVRTVPCHLIDWSLLKLTHLPVWQVCERLQSRIAEASAWSSCSLIVQCVYRFLIQMAGLCALVSHHLIT